MRSHLPPQAFEYIRSTFAKEDAALKEVGRTLSEKEAVMQTGPEEGKLLFVLAKMIAAKKVVEIGILAGHSAIWMARALPEDGCVYAIDKNHKRIALTRSNAEACKVEDKVRVLQGVADEVLGSIADEGPFDMVFIDADKANYVNYLDWWQNNVRKGGIIAGDNTLLFGSTYGQPLRKVSQRSVDAMKLFNARLADPNKYASILLPTADGMTIAVKLF